MGAFLPDRDSFQPGQRIAQRFTLGRLLGQGGMGQVWAATDEEGAAVALKLVRSKYTSDAEFLERFRREGRIARDLVHPNIVRTWDLHNEGELYFLVMEHLTGEPLSQRIQASPGGMGSLDVARVARGIAAALSHAHGLGVLHRDVKPQNIFCTADGGVKLLDFGLAVVKEGARLTSFAASGGTPGYRAPEQERDFGSADERADQFSLAAVLFEMLTGRVPDPAALSRGAPGALPSGVPKPMARALARALSVDREARFASVEEFCAAFCEVGETEVAGGARDDATSWRPAEGLRIGRDRRYELREKLGEGGMGEVWAADDRERGEPVAVKVIREEHRGALEFRQRFEREASILLRLDHDHIVRAFDAELDQGTPFLAMELLRGESLAAALARRAKGGQRFEPQEVERAAVQLGGALLHAHEQGVIHRDVKPGNVFCTRGGDYKLMDFGIALAKEEASLTQGERFHSGPYSAPEMSVDFSGVTELADQYSLAVVLAEMLTGEVERSRVRFPPGVPRRMRRALRRALGEQPSQRFESLHAFRQAFTGQERPLLTVRRAVKVATLMGALLLCQQVAPAPRPPPGPVPAPRPVIETRASNTLDRLDAAIDANDVATLQAFLQREAAAIPWREAARSGVLQRVMRGGDGRILEALLEAGALTDAPDEGGETPLRFALALGDAEAVQALLDHGADPRQLVDHLPPLFWLCRHGGASLIPAFVNAGAEVGALDENGETALFAAVEMRDKDSVEALLGAGIDCGVVSRKDGDTALVRAVRGSHRPVVEALIRTHRELVQTSRDRSRWTLLHIAVAGGNAEIVQLLAQTGMTLEVENNAGDNPLHHAVRQRSLEVIRTLAPIYRKAGLLEKPNRYGETALDLAERAFLGPDTRRLLIAE